MDKDISINRFKEFEALYQTPGKKYDIGELDKFINTAKGDEIVVNFLNWILPYATQIRASDIHLSDQENGCVVRIRGQNTELHQEFLLSRASSHEIDIRIRARCQLNITDRERTLSGSFFFMSTTGGTETLIDVRVSITPTKMGQSIVMRILDSSNAGRHLNDIVMTDDVRDALTRALDSPEGMILSCGPTGSGKTSTLYACLNYLNNDTRHIMSAEDPVEYRLPGANQVSINHHRTFDQVLREFMRQDPDVILVGEIRDDITAATAIKAANTGHLVLSTLHANSAEITIPRLIGLGVERYSIAGALRGFFAQRLTKRLCKCAVIYKPTEEELLHLDRNCVPAILEEFNYMKVNPEGCDECLSGNTGLGYAGRVPIFEFVENTPDVTKAILSGNPDDLHAAMDSQNQYQNLTTSAVNLSAFGFVDFHEAAYLVNRS